jgi:hypothetical protein
MKNYSRRYPYIIVFHQVIVNFLFSGDENVLQKQGLTIRVTIDVRLQGLQSTVSHQNSGRTARP